MSAGLRVWNASGQLVTDTASKHGIYLGSASVGTTNGSVTVSDFSLGTPFWVLHNTSGDPSNYSPALSLSGNTLSWTWPTSGYANNAPCVLIYGVL